MSPRLILKNLLAHPLRSILTLGSVALAVFLVCMLQAVVTALSSATSAASSQRLWVQSAVSLFVDLPLSYESKIAGVAGVETVCKFQWFGGEYRDGGSFFAQFGVDADTFGPAYPELDVVDGSYDAFAGRRDGCLVGQALADQYGWKVGQTVPIIGRIFPRVDGSAWDFVIQGIYRAKTTAVDERTLYFHFDYLREAIEQGAVRMEPGVGVYLVDLRDGAEPTAVMSAIDALFENGPQRVQTTTEAEFARQFVTMLGSVPVLLRSIGGAVLFAIFFAILNTMLMAARERTRDLGVLKALGFTDRWVFVGLTVESLLLCVLGGAIGIAVAFVLSLGVAKAIASFVPGFEIAGESVALGMGLSIALGLVAGCVPAWNASRLKPVAALRAED
ncbi:MAG: ABC transporter permease [Planctomycetes bacterium]|nr:ABC transporter permease [Planctomycetota bacterium]